MRRSFECCNKSSLDWPLHTCHSTQAGRHCPTRTTALECRERDAGRATNWKLHSIELEVQSWTCAKRRSKLQGTVSNGKHAVETQFLPDGASVLESRDEEDGVILL